MLLSVREILHYLRTMVEGWEYVHLFASKDLVAGNMDSYVKYILRKGVMVELSSWWNSLNKKLKCLVEFHWW